MSAGEPSRQGHDHEAGGWALLPFAVALPPLQPPAPHRPGGGSTWRGFSRTVLTAQRGGGVRAELDAWSSPCLPTFPVSLEVLALSLVLQGQPLRHRGRQSPGVTGGRAAQHRVNGKW